MCALNVIVVLLLGMLVFDIYTAVGSTQTATVHVNQPSAVVDPEPPAPPKEQPAQQVINATASALEGLQTKAQCDRMWAACPQERRLTAAQSLPFSTFMNNVFDTLDHVDVGKRPIDYIFENFSRLWQKHGALDTGMWAEFGVFTGGTLVNADNSVKNTSAEVQLKGSVAGFDSFEGLPEKWRRNFEAGTFRAEGLYEQVRARVLAAVELYKGWFQDTISTFLAKYPTMPASFVHHDGDLFISTTITFSLLHPYIVPRTMFCLDELHSYPGYEKHEILSFYLWLVASAAEVCSIANFGKMNPARRTGRTEAHGHYQSACFQVLKI